LDVVLDTERLRKSDIPCVQGGADRLKSVTGWSRKVERVWMLSSVLDYWRDYYAANPEISL
jgi:hypothetical protein